MHSLNSLRVGVEHYIILSALMFVIGMIGVLIRKNTLVILMSIELMLNATNIAFVAFGKFNGGLEGQAIVFFVMAIAASEAAVGLAIAVAIFKRFNGVNIRFFENLKG